MRSNLVVANWKMHGRKTEVTQRLDAIKNGIMLDTEKNRSERREVVICPPSLYLGQVQNELVGTEIAIGAQNAHPQNEGAFTGEISFAMLKEFSCSHVIIGHSERREIFSEDNNFIAEKFAAAKLQAITPILCVGETQAQREDDLTESTVLAQLQAVISKVGIQGFADAVIAYEPIWAIGTGLTASPEQAQEVHATIRSFLSAQDNEIAENMLILYGGSVKAANAKALFEQKDIDGALVGGASLDAEEFITICASAA